MPSSRRLWLIAVSMVAVYVLVAWLHPGRADRTLRHVVTIVMTLSLLGLFYVGWRELRAEDAPGAKALFLGFALLAGAALFVPPFQSSDVYAYGQIGWLQAAYGENPYVVVPAELDEPQPDPMFTRTWSETPCVYGFLFAWITRGVATLGGGDPQTTVLLFKVLAALSWLLVGWLVLGELNRVGSPGQRRTLYWLLWSPFVILQAVANGHNDGLFAVCLLGAVLAARRGRVAWVLPALALATLIKLVALVAVPPALVFLVRNTSPRRIVASLLLALGVSAAISAPYLVDAAAFDWAGIQAQLTAPSYSLLAAIADSYAALAGGLDGTWFSASNFTRVLSGLALLAYTCFVAVRFLGAWRRPTFSADDFTREALLLLFVLILLASAKFFPWYLLMVLPLAALLDEGDLLRDMLFALTLTWLLVFTGLGKSRIADALVMTAIPLWLCLRRRVRAPEAPPRTT